MIANAERRLGVIFQRAILVALAGLGCGTKAAEAVSEPDAGTAGVDASTEGGTTVDAGKEAAPFDKCAPTPYTPTPVDMCGDYLRYPCGLPTDLTIRGDCIFALNDCAALCTDVHFSCRAADGYCSDAGPDAGDVPGTVVPDEAGAVVIDCTTCPGSAGRVPAGLVPEAVRASTALGAYFASAARLEAASVTAFRRLREELALYGAPSELVEGARSAEHDEVRHTRAMARLARRHGARYVRPRVLALVAPRSLAVVAEENIVEGCARETFGALLATWQAAHVAEAETARTLARIAADETRHAALSWAIARWSLAALGDGERARLEQAWRAALDQVVAGDGQVPLRGAALPTRDERARLAGELRDLWTALAA